MRPKRRQNRNRCLTGLSLIELLVSVAILGIAIAGITEVLWVNASWATRINNKLDNVYDAKLFVERFGRDVRMARNVGDLTVNPASTTYTTSYATFDMNSVVNPTVILQIPVYDNNGDNNNPPTPTYGFQIPSGSNPPSPVVDTVVYQVVADPSGLPNLYEIQYSAVPGRGQHE